MRLSCKVLVLSALIFCSPQARCQNEGQSEPGWPVQPGNAELPGRFPQPGFAGEQGAQMPPPRPWGRRPHWTGSGGDGEEPGSWGKAGNLPQPGFTGTPEGSPRAGRRLRPDNGEPGEFAPGRNFGRGPNGVREYGRGPGGEFGRGPGAGGPAGRRFSPGAGGGDGAGAGMNRQAFAGPLDLTALNLNQQQKDKIKQQREVNGARAKEIRQNLRSARMQMRDLLFDPAVSDAQIRLKRQQVTQLQGQLDDLLVNDFLAVRKVLTPEQREKLSELAPGKRRKNEFGQQFKRRSAQPDGRTPGAGNPQ